MKNKFYTFWKKAKKWVRLGLVLLAVAMMVFVLIQNRCTKRRAAALHEQFIEVQATNKVLMEQVKRIATINENLRFKDDSLLTVLSIQQEDNNRLKDRLMRLKKEYSMLETSIASIPPEEDYIFLNEAYPPILGKKNFPFDGTQIKGMRLTYQQRNSLLYLNNGLKELNDNLEGRLEGCLELADTRLLRINNLQHNFDTMESMYDHTNSLLIPMERNLQKCNKQKKWMLGGGVAGGVLITLLAIFISG